MKKLFVLLLLSMFGLNSFAYQTPAQHPVSKPATVKQEKKKVKKEKKKEKKAKKKEKKLEKKNAAGGDKAGNGVTKPKDGHGVGNGTVQPANEKPKHPSK